MEVGLQMVFASYGWDNVSDEQVWDEELRLARLAADLGFDVLWSVEHHFNDYSFCPDNLQLMSYLAADLSRTSDLGTAAVILPWHDPLRVAEQVSVLDHLSQGRLRLGMGRGLARREFEAFRGTMDESRGRFDEAAEMILRGLRTGFVEGERARSTRSRGRRSGPRPSRSFDGRVYAVASSDDSVVSAARLNARMVMFADRPWPMRMPAIQKHRDLVRAAARRGRRAPVAGRLLRLHADPGRRRGEGPPVHGQVRGEQLLPLRAAGSALQHREGLRRLRTEDRDGEGDRHGRDRVRVHGGRRLGPAGPHPSHVRGARARSWGTSSLRRRFASAARPTTWPSPGCGSTPRRFCPWCAPGSARSRAPTLSPAR